MIRLLNISRKSIQDVPVRFERYLVDEIDWSNRMIALSGARGSGKTVMLLQQMKKVVSNGKQALYVSLDDIYFTENRLIYFAEEFSQNGGEYLFLDEVHKYKNWSQEIKNIYDSIPDLRMVFTSSSALEIYRGSHDLSRRVLVFHLAGLSLREYINFKYEEALPTFELNDILKNKTNLIPQLLSKRKIIPIFKEYLKEGYYPFFNDSNSHYLMQLSTTINLVIESDLPAIHKIDFNSILKLKKLIAILARIVPYKPNIEKLARQIETTRPTLLKYLYYLDKAQIIKVLSSDSFGINFLNKPEKVYLANPNLAYTFGDEVVNKGNLRETFFLNQISIKHKVTYPKQGDFLVDNRFLFEIGGKAKTKKQIAGIDDSFVVIDEVEIGFGNKLPLWAFGFLY